MSEVDVKPPHEVVATAADIGERKAGAVRRGNMGRFMLSAMLAGAYIALGGVLSVIIGYGFPELTAGNPALQRLLSGCVFPIGLILVVVLGAELFTGNNALLVPALMSRRCTWAGMLRNWGLVYVGNFIGAVAFTYLFVYQSGLTASEPYHGAIVRIAEAKVEMLWGVVFLKGIGANWCVCLAVWLALSGRTLIEKMAGCWLPVMAFVALGYEHSIANMFFIPAGLLEGASASSWLWANLVPATLGNIVGGAVFVGCAYSYLNLKGR